MRPSIDEYFMDIAKLVAKRSSCLRRHVGAVFVKNKHIIATGYNGAPAGLKHCEELGGCLREQMKIPRGERQEICRATHAEQNAIIQAALHGVSTQGSTMYCTDSSCFICSKMLITAGIKRIVYERGYPEDMGLEMLKQAGIEITKYPDSV